MIGWIQRTASKLKHKRNFLEKSEELNFATLPSYFYTRFLLQFLWWLAISWLEVGSSQFPGHLERDNFPTVPPKVTKARRWDWSRSMILEPLNMNFLRNWNSFGCLRIFNYFKHYSFSKIMKFLCLFFIDHIFYGNLTITDDDRYSAALFMLTPVMWTTFCSFFHAKNV